MRGLVNPAKATLYTGAMQSPDGDHLLINLSIISKIAPKDKIYTTDEGYISIDNSTMIQGMVRFIFSNSRSKSVSNLSNFFSNVFAMVDAMCDTSGDEKWQRQCRPNANTLLVYIQKSVQGVENLKQTYANDVVITSKLDIIIDNIHSSIAKLNKVLHR